MLTNMRTLHKNSVKLCDQIQWKILQIEYQSIGIIKDDLYVGLIFQVECKEMF